MGIPNSCLTIEFGPSAPIYENKERNTISQKWQKEDSSRGAVKLTRSFVWRVSPLASVTRTHGTESAAWWGMGHVYFTTLDLYLTWTLSDNNKGTKNETAFTIQCDFLTLQGRSFKLSHQISSLLLFPLKSRKENMVCPQPKWWEIYKPPHKTPLVFPAGTCGSYQA